MVAKPAPEPATTIAGVMGADHHRLHAGLHRHIEIEKAMLFPLLEAQIEMQAAEPTSVMRKEHRQIEAMLKRLHQIVATGQCAALLQGFNDEPDESSALLANHDSMEEAILYPFMDRVFDPVERREFLSAVQEFEI